MRRRGKGREGPDKGPSRELKRSKESPRPDGGGPVPGTAAVGTGAIAGTAAVAAGQQVGGASAVTGAQTPPLNELAHEATNSLAHHATEGFATEAAAAATGAGVAVIAGTSAGGAAGVGGVSASGAAATAGIAASAGGGAGTSVAAGAAAGAGAAVGTGAAGAAAAGGGASTAGGAAAAGPGGQAIAIGAVATAAAATVVVVVVATGDDPPVAEPAPTTTTTVAPAPAAETPTPGPGTFETLGVDPLDGNLFDGVDQNTAAGPLMVAGLQGEPTNVGVPITLLSGAVLTVDPLGAFQYTPAEAASQLAEGQTIVDSFTYMVTNANGFLEEWTAQVTVVGQNAAPTVEAVAGISVVEGAAATQGLTADDPDGDAVAFRLGEDAPDFVSLTEVEGGGSQLLLEPGAGTAGTYEFTLEASDGVQSNPTSAQVTVTVTAAPEEKARVVEDLVALYEFDEAGGDVVGDSSGAGISPQLVVADPTAVTWADGAITIVEPTILRSGAPANELTAAIVEANQFTIEAWVTPADDSQDGPARIVSISDGTALRNATLGQGGTEADGSGGGHWTARQRSTETSENGLPTLSTPIGSVRPDVLTHLVVTRNADGEVRFYVDGAVTATGVSAGDLSNWDGSFPLVVGNETTLDRPWRGSLYLVATYARALTDAEVQQNFSVGAAG